MNDETITQMLSRIEALERAVFATGATKQIKVRHGVAATPSSLSEHILKLRDDGFLAEPKSAREIHAKLEKVYPCELNRVAVELIRISGRRQLRKSSKDVDGKKLTAYVR